MPGDLVETLREAQRFGFFGDRPIEQAIEHSLDFVTAIGTPPPGMRLVDLGSGGGLPGLVLADRFPSAEIVLVDRRQKRTDFLERAVRRLGYAHVTVRSVDVRQIVREVAAGELAPFDVVTARGFGPPSVTLRAAAALIVPSGRIVISEPPAGDRWSEEPLTSLGLVGARCGAVRLFTGST